MFSSYNLYIYEIRLFFYEINNDLFLVYLPKEYVHIYMSCPNSIFNLMVPCGGIKRCTGSRLMACLSYLLDYIRVRLFLF